MIITWNSFLAYLHFAYFFFLGFVLFLRLEHISLSSFCLILCVYFSILSKLVTFPDLREVALCRRHTMGPASHSSWVPRVICSRDALYVGCVGLSFVAGLTTVGVLVGRTGPQPDWLHGSVLCGGCWATGGWVSVPVQLAAQSMGFQDWCWPTGEQVSPWHLWARGRAPKWPLSAPVSLW